MQLRLTILQVAVTDPGEATAGQRKHGRQHLRSQYSILKEDSPLVLFITKIPEDVPMDHQAHMGTIRVIRQPKLKMNLTKTTPRMENLTIEVRLVSSMGIIDLVLEQDTPFGDELVKYQLQHIQDGETHSRTPLELT